jgi:hypothetical protein
MTKGREKSNERISYVIPLFFFLRPGCGAPSTIFLSSTYAPSEETTIPIKKKGG